MGKLFSHHSSTSLPTETAASKSLVARSYSTCSTVTSPTLLSLFRIRSKSLQSNFSDLPKLITRSHSISHSRTHSRSSDASHSFVQTPVTPTCASMDDLAYYSEANDTEEDENYDESDMFDVFLISASGTGAISANTSSALMTTPSPIPLTRRAHSRKTLDLDSMLPPLPPTDNRQFQENIINTPEQQHHRKTVPILKRDSDKAVDLATCILSLVNEDKADYDKWVI